MIPTELSEILEKHRKWLAGEAGGQRADLRGYDLSGYNLRGADLIGADLRGVNLYNCCLPLWCGGLHIKLDRRQMVRLIYHFCSMVCEDPEVVELQKSLYAFANEFVASRNDLKRFPEVG